MLPSFLRWPAAGRCRHPAPDAAKFIAQAIGALKPETLMCADRITNALLSQQKDNGAGASAGAAKREAFEGLAQSFAAETRSLPDSEADQLISALLVVMAATNGKPKKAWDTMAGAGKMSWRQERGCRLLHTHAPCRRREAAGGG
jgi:hypothetical protein